MEKPVIIIIDMLKDFFADGPLAEAKSELVFHINQLIKSARIKDVPIIWVRQEFEPDLSDAFLAQRNENIKLTIKGTPGVELLDDLDRHPNDHEIIKKRYSAFFNTNLDELLKKLQPTKLVMAGVNSHACVRMTAIDAYQRDYEVEIILECVDSKDKEHHRVSLDYMNGHICNVIQLKSLVL